MRSWLVTIPHYPWIKQFVHTLTIVKGSVASIGYSICEVAPETSWAMGLFSPFKSCQPTTVRGFGHADLNLDRVRIAPCLAWKAAKLPRRHGHGVRSVRLVRVMITTPSDIAT
ncbi:hypothetical protein [Streptomyces sp. NPDC056069]|uniref:hypothetical protein n=1 Tax=Streptomyces sp. NPDC056069 TaxID=3345702 RepID=UPI0035DFF1DF